MTSSKPPARSASNGGGKVPQRRREPHLSPPAYVLNKHDSRVLDPDNAVRFPGQIIRPTVYVASELLVRYGAFDEVRKPLAEAAGESLKLEITRPDPKILAFARKFELVELAERILTVRVRFVAADPEAPLAPADAWTILQRFRAAVGRKSAAARAVTLNHLLSASVDIGGAPKSVGQGAEGAPKSVGQGAGGPSDAYGVIGYGGRQPVNWIGAPPVYRPDAIVNKEAGRRPVVVVLDTGAGEHDWLPPTIVDRQPKVGSTRIGLIDSKTNPERTGVVGDPLEGVLDADAGHGTFIAGLIRQKCPDAKVLAVRVMYGDGAVNEQELVDVLNWLVLRQAAAQQSGPVDQIIDVVSLSLGYYHEEPADVAYDQLLMLPLTELSLMGVAVVAAAGNDATSRHMYPAGFAPHPGGQVKRNRNGAPLVSVGATNPNDRTTALFSNDGDWVIAKRPGASVVSTLPKTFDAALEPTARVVIKGLGVRETIDPDDFRGGFAVWSGTSFSAPILAGEIAQKLLEAGKLDVCDTASTVTRAWGAISELTKLRRP
ncbi:Subtilase family protein [Frankineae bacterium MT45]|nr:Subtilase family protein [Frankineae bacterium MT45]